MTDFSHLHALEAGLANELQRLSYATTEGERALRSVWVSQYEKQISDEKHFIGIDCLPEITDDELLAELIG
jgi:hypothetical protein